MPVIAVAVLAYAAGLLVHLAGARWHRALRSGGGARGRRTPTAIVCASGAALASGALVAAVTRAGDVQCERAVVRKLLARGARRSCDAGRFRSCDGRELRHDARRRRRVGPRRAGSDGDSCAAKSVRRSAGMSCGTHTSWSSPARTGARVGKQRAGRASIACSPRTPPFARALLIADTRDLSPRDPRSLRGGRSRAHAFDLRFARRRSSPSRWRSLFQLLASRAATGNAGGDRGRRRLRRCSSARQSQPCGPPRCSLPWAPRDCCSGRPRHGRFSRSARRRRSSRRASCSTSDIS